MTPRESHREIFCRRLKQARIASGLSQKNLGIIAGIDEFVASTRINRYEKGVHEVDINTAQKLAKALQVPLPYFYAEDDKLADVILKFSKIPVKFSNQILLLLDILSKPELKMEKLNLNKLNSKNNKKPSNNK